jgi:hypothetical protein
MTTEETATMVISNNARKSGNYVCDSAFGVYLEGDSLALFDWAVFDLIANLEADSLIDGAFDLVIVAELGDIFSPPSNE